MYPRHATSRSLPSVEEAASTRPRLRLVFARDDASASHAGPTDAPKILIVEDDFLVAEQMMNALGEAGFQTTSFASAEEAIALAKTERPLLVIMDIRLAGKLDGVDAALELFRTLGTRCIFATAHHDADARRRAEPAQPLAWLHKPYTMFSLVEVVRSNLKKLKN